MRIKYLTPEDVCEWLCIERPYLSRLVNEKQFPVTRLGYKSLRFDESKVVMWLEKRNQGLES